MFIKPLHVIIPGQECAQPCVVCATRDYPLCPTSCLVDDAGLYLLCKTDYAKRLAFARDLGANSLFLLGNCAPQKNRDFIEKLGILNNQLQRPFQLLELTTNGAFLSKEYVYFLRSALTLTNICLTVAAFNDDINSEYMGKKISLTSLISDLTDLRALTTLKIYLTSYFDIYKDIPSQLFKDVQTKFKAQRITFERIQSNDIHKHPWLKGKAASNATVESIYSFISRYGIPVSKRENGDSLFQIEKASVILPAKDKYDAQGSDLVLRGNGSLYEGWNNHRLIF